MVDHVSPLTPRQVSISLDLPTDRGHRVRTRDSGGRVDRRHRRRCTPADGTDANRSESAKTGVPPLSARTEWWNTLTHGGTAVAAAVGLVAIVVVLSQGATAAQWAAGLAFGSSLTYLYLASFLSHYYSWRLDPERRRFWRRQDQVGILVTAACSLAPLAVHAEGVGVLVFPLMTLAVAYLLIALVRQSGRTLNPLYMAQMGWLPPLAAIDIARLGGTPGMMLAGGGGLCYLGGLVFLMNDGRRWWFHPVWHLFAAAGSAMHYAFLVGWCL